MNENKFIPIDQALAVLDSHVTDNCIVVGTEGFKIEENKIYPDMDMIYSMTSLKGKDPATSVATIKTAQRLLSRWIIEKPGTFVLISARDKHGQKISLERFKG